MKAIALAVTVCGVLVSGAAWAEDAAMAPVHQFIDGLNAGDAKKAAAAFVASAPIVDEFAPFHWGSFDAWLADFQADAKKNGTTDVHVKLLRPTTSTIRGDDAYEIVPNVITGKSHGKPGKEKGIFTFALTKTPDGWRIAGWAWTKQ